MATDRRASSLSNTMNHNGAQISPEQHLQKKCQENHAGTLLLIEIALAGLVFKEINLIIVKRRPVPGPGNCVKTIKSQIWKRSILPYIHCSISHKMLKPRSKNHVRAKWQRYGWRLCIWCQEEILSFATIEMEPEGAVCILVTYIIRKRTMEDHIICFNIKAQSKGRHKTKPNSLGFTCKTEVTRAERREIRESRGPNELGGGSLVLPRSSVDLFI